MSDLATNFNAAVQLQAAGDLPGATLRLEALLSLHPGDTRIATQLALVRLQRDQLQEAIAACTIALAGAPNNALAHAWAGEAYRRMGDLPSAIASLERALALRADLAPALFNIGLAYVGAGEPMKARGAWQEFLRLRPNDSRIRRELGLLAFDERDYSSALAWFREQLDLDTTDLVARCDLASTYLRMRRWSEAREVLDAIHPANPADFRVSLLLGQALAGEGRFAEAIKPLGTAQFLKPESFEAAFELGIAHDRLANLESAIQYLSIAARLAPGRADVLAALAVAELNCGELDQAIEHYRHAVDVDPTAAEIHSALLMAMHYVDLDPAAVLQEHLRWAARHAAAVPASPTSFANEVTSTRRLRIGYLSPRFGNGPLAHFFLPLLRAHDHQKVEIFGFMVAEHSDSATEEMRRLTDQWRDVPRLSDEELMAAIRSDRIDILVDMAGHCPGNKLGVFAQRAAPIQISWLDYDDTTGVPAMDYYLSDELLTPVNGAQAFTETLLFVAPVRATFAPSTMPPEPGPPPQLRRGHVTFGCVNRISKLGPAVIDAWARILKRTPRSRLVLQATAFVSAEPQEVMRRRFAHRGIAPDRLDLRPFSDELTMLKVYREIDIALDPFPYNGCNTTCDALSMGVPVVTLEGTTLCGRHGVALLSACGLHDWVTRDVSEYVELACARAADVAGVSALRALLPQQFLDSPICDAAMFAKGLEAAYVRLWQHWSSSCRNETAPL